MGSLIRLSTVVASLLLLVGCGPSMVMLPAQTCTGGQVKACQTECDGGDPESCYRLGWLHEEGIGAAQSDRKAISLYKKSCDAGYATACRALGNIYWEGETAARNPKRALEMWDLACAAGVGSCPSEATRAEALGRAPRLSGAVSAQAQAEGKKPATK